MADLRVRPCSTDDVDEVRAIINEAAEAYRGVIAQDCWREPYMPKAEMDDEIDAGVRFWGCEEAGDLVGVMGLQRVGDAWLIRHAYVRPSHQRRGVGALLLDRLREESEGPMLVGTWAAAAWAIEFYESRGFARVSASEKDELLRRHWHVSPRQMEESVVLVDREAYAVLPDG